MFGGEGRERNGPEIRPTDSHEAFLFYPQASSLVESVFSCFFFLGGVEVYAGARCTRFLRTVWVWCEGVIFFIPDLFFMWFEMEGEGVTVFAWRFFFCGRRCNWVSFFCVWCRMYYTGRRADFRL